MTRAGNILKNRVIFCGLILICIVLSFGKSDGVAQVASPAAPGALFTGSENHSISLADAVKLTHAYQSTAPQGSVLAEYFGRDAIVNLLNQSNCVGLRIYKGRRADGKDVMVIVGVDSSGVDRATGSLCEIGYGCPPICDGTSPLMSH
jgi:hypothetical protein